MENLFQKKSFFKTGITTKILKTETAFKNSTKKGFPGIDLMLYVNDITTESVIFEQFLIVNRRFD